jgi:serine/threonine-protein kinase
MKIANPHAPGTRIGSFEIVRSLGIGGMGHVHEARHTKLGKRVAIKVLHRHLAANAVAAERFAREGRAASAIRHPNIVEVFEIGTHEGTPYLVIELLEGEDLGRRLLFRGRLPPAEAVDILIPTASAVAAAHAAGVIHRDLSPRNVFLASERRSGMSPKVLDFGMSKLSRAESGHRLTESGTILGTLDYMAPEQARSAKCASERSDQYALAAILYECVTGQKPFKGRSAYELMQAIAGAPLATPRSLGAEIDPGLEAVILRALHRDPNERFESVRAFGRALLPFATERIRDWWREDFEGASSRRGATGSVVLERSAASPMAASESHLAATLPERRASRRSPASASGSAGRAVVLAAAVLAAVFAVAVVTKLAGWGQEGKPLPAVQQPVVSLPAEPSGPLPALAPLEEPAVAVPTPGEPAPASIAARTAPPRSSAAQNAAPPVERGANGAPIIP